MKIDKTNYSSSKYSDEYQEIIGYIPHWIIRFGILFMSVFLFIALIGTILLRYPDVVKANIVLTTNSPPIRMISRADGKIMKLFVKNKQRVLINDTIAIIENPADINDVLKLKKSISRYENAKSKGILAESFSDHLILGELQSAYEDFKDYITEYTNFLKLNYFGKKINECEDSRKIEEMNLANLLNQLQFYKEDLALANNQYNRIMQLFKEGIVAENEIDINKSNILQKKNTILSINTSIANNRMSIAQLVNSINDYKIQFEQQKEKHTINISSALKALKGQVQQWEFRYVIKSPIIGLIDFSKYWTVNQNIKDGELVCTIISAEYSKIVGKIVLPLEGSGKVKAGQKVIIKLLDYPYQEYGIIQGNISSKSVISSESAYSVEVDLKNSLRTDFGIDILFNQEMYGECEIITKNISLFNRLFSILLSLKKRHIGNQSFEKMGVINE